MKVGIVGTGISGLAAGWLLHRAGHSVTLLDRMSQLGLDAHSADVEFGSDRAESESDVPTKLLRVDVPPRMFNQALWPNLTRLYRSVGVEVETVDGSKSFGDTAGRVDFKLQNSFVQLSLKTLFSRNAWRIASDIRRMKREVPSDLDSSELDAVDFGAYLASRGYSKPFLHQFLLPALASTLCTCSYACLNQYPARTMLQSMLQLVETSTLLRVRFGSSDVAARLTRGISDIRLNSSVDKIVPLSDGVRLELASGAGLTFDHLILATQANTAARLLAGPTAEERAMLESFSYDNVEIVLHSDARLMPARRKDWANFNILTDPGNTDAMCTVWMN